MTLRNMSGYITHYTGLTRSPTTPKDSTLELRAVAGQMGGSFRQVASPISGGARTGYWDDLVGPERGILLCRELVYDGDTSRLRRAISEGMDHIDNLLFADYNPLDAVAALELFETRTRRLDISDVPEPIRSELPTANQKSDASKLAFISYILDSGVLD